MVMRKLGLFVALLSGAASAAVPFKNGTRFALNDVPGELVVERRAGEPVRFALVENGTTGYLWSAEWNTNECEVILDHRGSEKRNARGELLCGAAGTVDVTVTSKIYTPARIEFAYRRPWEKGVKPIRALKLIVYTVGERWRTSASATDLYGEMLAHSSEESLLDVEMACVEGRWDRMTVEFLCNELKTEDPVKLRFEDEQMDRHSLAAYFLSTLLDIKLPKESEQPPCLIRCRLVPDETEVHRGFMSPHRIHVFRISEAGRKFALEKGLAYLRNGKH